MGMPVADLAAIHAAFADPVVYTGAGLTAAPLTAICSDVPADAFLGAGATARHISFEFRASDLPSAPGKGDIIVHDGVNWSVIDIVRRRDIAAWSLSVEKAL
ncbi:MAG: hypothetical protein KA533_07505 [Sphingobium sp.]|nr:hypothetical protein [Sphingobium sp.]MBP6112577.1 hypothetical protein [Sphingobium sp.]MBP8671629.1 hypothetical protein [Sphingobium sp.]MBP9158607.1 hypothetical protein [Sphingobium sp.]